MYTMVTQVVTFRLEREELDLLRKQGINPAELAKQQVRNFVRGIRAERGMRRAQQLLKEAGTKPFDAGKMQREMREELDRRH
jgi:hypothetical protein